MGIQGLSTYLRENRRLLAKSLQFTRNTDDDEGPSTPIVVDGWGFIYNLHQNSNLPWVYGGEYESFCKLVETVVRSLIGVGLKLYFVFDGPCPRLKFDTVLSRLVQNKIQPSSLFFRTSSSSRATPRFLKEPSSSIIPPRLYTACVHSLQELARCYYNTTNEKTSASPLEVHFADEEADSYAVELAGRIGGYVLSLDSDFVVFNTDNYLGYIPLDEMVWNASDGSVSESDPPEDDGDFQLVRSPKEKQKMSSSSTHSPTFSRGIVPPSITSGLTLSVEFYSPSTLASHLDIPVSLLPLFGAFVGNDYSKPSMSSSSSSSSKNNNTRSRFFERQWTAAQKITHVAATLRSTLASSSQKRRQRPVGSVMELIERTVAALLDRSIPSMSSTEVQGIIDKIVEATLPYTIPKMDQPNGGGLWPTEICALHEPDMCRILPIFSRRIAFLASSVGEESDAVRQQDTIRCLYLAAYRNGELSPQVIDVLNTGSYWPKFFLENPDAPTVSVCIGRRIRQWGYSILEDAVGLPGAEDTEEEEGDRVDQGRDDDDEDELVDVVEESGEEDSSIPLLRDELKLEDGIPEQPKLTPPLQSIRPPTLPKVVTEYVRRGTRAVKDEVTVPSLATLLSSVSGFENTHEPTPLLLRPEDERLTVLLCGLGSDTVSVKTLPREQLAVALALRWVLHCAHSRAQESGGGGGGGGSKVKERERWTRHEAKSFLASFSWTRPSNGGGGGVTEEMTTACIGTVPIEDRNVQLMAQVLMALESIHHFTQILLLSERVPMPVHLFSGKTCHAYWTGVSRLEGDAEPPLGLWEACTGDLEEEGVFLEIRENRKKKKKKGKADEELVSALTGGRARGGLFGLLDHVEA